jgi:hypothetical protein
LPAAFSGVIAAVKAMPFASTGLQTASGIAGPALVRVALAVIETHIRPAYDLDLKAVESAVKQRSFRIKPSV